MFIKSVDSSNKDIFLGKGWDNWIRMTRSGDTFLRTAGMHLTTDVVAKINQRLKAFEELTARKMSGIYNNK